MGKKEHVTSLKLLYKAKEQAQQNNWYPQLFSAMNNIGGNYYLMLDYGEALDNYLDAYGIAVKHLDESKEMIVLNNIGILYSKQGELKKAEQYFLKAYELAERLKIFRKKGYYAINLGSLYNQKRNPGLALLYLKQALPLLQKDREQLFLAHIALAKNDLISGRSGRAREKAIELLSQGGASNSDNGIQLHIIIAQSYLDQQKPKQAIEWLQKASALHPDIEKDKVIFELLSKSHYQEGNYRDALHFSDSVVATVVRGNEITNGRLFAASAAKLKLAEYRVALSDKNRQINKQRLIFAAIIIVVALLVTTAFLFLKNRINRITYRKKQAESQREIADLLVLQLKDERLLAEERAKIATLQQQFLEKEIELQQQKMSSKALYISERDHLLQEILKSLGKIPELKGKRQLLDTIRLLKQHISVDDHWDNFSMHFQQVNQSFIRKLTEKHPNLNSNEVRYLSYIYMNLTAKEIATILNISPEALRKRKERIVEKLALKDDISIYSYISSI
jgi:tetratricopeptide (TPR) repeat protein